MLNHVGFGFSCPRTQYRLAILAVVEFAVLLVAGGLVLIPLIQGPKPTAVWTQDSIGRITTGAFGNCRPPEGKTLVLVQCDPRVLRGKDLSGADIVIRLPSGSSLLPAAIAPDGLINEVVSYQRPKYIAFVFVIPEEVKAAEFGFGGRYWPIRLDKKREPSSSIESDFPFGGWIIDSEVRTSPQGPG